MVVESLDLGHLGLFLGLRVNELVIEGLKAAGFGEARQSHGFVIQHLIEGERTITQLAARLEVTQQAASKTVAEMVRLGILQMAPSADDRRTRVIRLSARAWEGVRFSRKERIRVEARLVKAIGKKRYAEARDLLIRCLGALGSIERVEARRVRVPG